MTPAFGTKLRDGMVDFGDKFAALYSNGRDEDALADTFLHVFGTGNHFVYAIIRTNGPVQVVQLLSPSYSEDGEAIMFKIAGKVRNFRLQMRRDQRYSMNVALPLFDNPLTYLQGVAAQVKLITDAQGAKFLLANSLISRCK